MRKFIKKYKHKDLNIKFLNYRGYQSSINVYRNSFNFYHQRVKIKTKLKGILKRFFSSLFKGKINE